MDKRGQQKSTVGSLQASGRNIRVCFIVGGLETLHCGVKDYVYYLAEALQTQGITAEVHAPTDWSIRSFLKFRSTLRAKRFNVVHVQYPSIGFRYSLFPHLLGLAALASSACVTLHEYSRLPKVQRWSTHFFRLSSKMLIFSTEEEQATYVTTGGSLGQRSTVIPIGSNLPASGFPRVRIASVVYFGQLRPDKGLETFLELARHSKEQGRHYRFTVLGACLPKHTDYVVALRKQTADLLIEWRLDQPAEMIATQMAQSLAAYLPFPDGATFSRGSLIGALVNGMPIIATISAATPPDLRQVLLAAASTQEAMAQLDRLEASVELQAELSSRSRVLGSRFSWTSIAKAHTLLYQMLCGPVPNGAERPVSDPLNVKLPVVEPHRQFTLSKEKK